MVPDHLLMLWWVAQSWTQWVLKRIHKVGRKKSHDVDIVGVRMKGVSDGFHPNTLYSCMAISNNNPKFHYKSQLCNERTLSSKAKSTYVRALFLSTEYQLVFNDNISPLIKIRPASPSKVI